MGVYIKGMEMPTSCDTCRLFNNPWCMAKPLEEWRTGYYYPPKGEKQSDCPLIEVPPHGDLTDRDTLKKSLHEAFDDADTHAFELGAYWHHSVVVDVVNNTPTIIEAEEEK